MSWRERDHPRDDVGRFRDRVGGWVTAVSERLGRRQPVQSEPEYVEPDPFALEARIESGPGFGAPDLIQAGRADDTAQAAYDAAAQYPRENMEVLAGRMLYRGGGVGPHGDEALHHIAQAQGFESPAQSVTSTEMDEQIRRGGLELWRGVRPSHDGQHSASEVHRRYREGEPYQGLGFAGNGTYFSSSYSEASSYGEVGRYALHPDARIVGFRTLQREQVEYLRQVGPESVLGRVMADTGRYAAMRGYDAIMWHRGEEMGRARGVEDEVIVLNRGALLAEVT
mgnify:CR=1 FL=1